MSAAFDLMVYAVPWWVQGLIAAALVAIVTLGVVRLLGIRRALQLGGVLGTLAALVISRQQARQDGWRARGECDEQAARQKADEREAIQADLRASRDADLDRRLGRWVRDAKR